MNTVFIDTSTGRLQNLSQEEIDRRIRSVRELLTAEGLDLIFVVNPACGGYRCWFTGASGPERASEGGILIGRSGDIVSVMGGGLAPRGVRLPENYSQGVTGGNSIYRGVTEIEGFYAEVIEDVARQEPGDADMEGGGIRAGIVNGEWMRADLLDFLREQFDGITFEDITEKLAAVKAVKSEEELASMREAARMMDKVFASACVSVRLQVYERDIVNDMRYAAYQTGCGGPDYLESAKLRLISGTDGVPAEEEEPVWPGRLVTEGDRVDIRMYCMGTNSLYGMLARSYTVGEPSEQTKAMWETARKAQQIAAAALVPGVLLRDVARLVNEFLDSRGYQRDPHTFLHGLGYVVGEAPLLYHPSEELPLAKNMVIVIEPTVSDGVHQPLCCGDAFVVTPEGGKRLGTFPQELIRL